MTAIPISDTLPDPKDSEIEKLMLALHKERERVDQFESIIHEILKLATDIYIHEPTGYEYAPWEDEWQTEMSRRLMGIRELVQLTKGNERG